ASPPIPRRRAAARRGCAVAEAPGLRLDADAGGVVRVVVELVRVERRRVARVEEEVRHRVSRTVETDRDGAARPAGARDLDVVGRAGVGVERERISDPAGLLA